VSGTNASKEKVRYAVVGAGNIAQVAVLPAFAHARQNSELAAIISDDPLKRSVLGRMYDVDTGCYAELEDVVRRASVNAIYIALPNDLHREFTERGARAGLHVLCEKPMAMSSEGCRAMIRACEAASVRLMVAYRLHFEEANLRAVELVRSGRLGNPRFLSACFSQQVRNGNIRTQADRGGGALFDMGIYCINAARVLFGAEPSEVFACRMSGADERFDGVDEMTSGVLRFPEGRAAQFTASQGAADVDTLRIVGTDGELRMEPAFGYANELRHSLTVRGKNQETSFAKRDQFAAELVYFSQCVLDGAKPEPSGYEGLGDVRVMEALERSALSGVTEVLDSFDPGARPSLLQEIHRPPVRPPRTVHAPSPTR
jgi:predicted dehydrogenase